MLLLGDPGGWRWLWCYTVVRMAPAEGRAKGVTQIDTKSKRARETIQARPLIGTNKSDNMCGRIGQSEIRVLTLSDLCQ